MNREESTIFSTFLLSLLIFLCTSTAEIQARELQQICSSSCGDIKNISYPFRLKGDPGRCGDPDYELSCESNKTILEYFPGKYYVKRISYEEHTISVVDVNLANGSCSLPYSSVPIREYFSIWGSAYTIALGHGTEYFANFVNCSKNVTDQAYRQVPCLSKNQSNVYVGYGGHSISDMPALCSWISSIPIRSADVEHPSYKTIQKLLESGFDCIWPAEYWHCRAAGGFCDNRMGIFHFREGLPSLRLKILRLAHEIFMFIMSHMRYDEVASVMEGTFAVLGAMPMIEFYITVNLLVYGVILLIICRFILAPVVLLVFLIHRYRKTLKSVDKVEKFLYNHQSWMPKRYSYPEMIAITNHFQEKLGQGGFGSVYKGQLHTGQLIAVKMLENSKFSAEEFINEVSTIGRIHHVNVVQLLGFCSGGSKRALVYEYMPNGSLDKHIFSKKGEGQSFSWEKLHEIAFGTARGIQYLHGGCDVCILHFDIKPHNILLDHNFIPKVSDFGLAKFHPKESDFVSISATRGTIGYIAPELISRNFGTVSCKSDVYSFGMLLLEIAGGRRNSNMWATRSSKAYFPSWVYDQIIMGGDLELRIVTEIESMIARKLCIIGLWCIQVKAADRPTMTKVLEMLEGTIEDLQMPPKPFFSSSQQVSGREIEPDSSIEWLLSESIEECSLHDNSV